MTDTRNPLDGPFMSARTLTDSSDEPGYAIRPQPVLQDKLTRAMVGLRRAGLAPAEARRRASGTYSGWMSAILDRSTAESLEAYAERIGKREF